MGVEIEKLEKRARDIGRRIAEGVPEGAGFALVLFDFGPGGNMTYVSNGRRGDVATVLRELADKIAETPAVKA